MALTVPIVPLPSNPCETRFDGAQFLSVTRDCGVRLGQEQSQPRLI
jgi:hypothetical protein